MRNLFTPLIDWMLPICCVLCGQTTHGEQPNICKACIADLPWITHPCTRCGLPLPDSASESATCGQCLQNPPPYQELHALFSYEFPVDQLILRLKFQYRLQFAHLLGTLLAKQAAQYYTTALPAPAMLIPLPLHYRRIRTRGFNQATEIAKSLSKHLNIPLSHHVVKRKKHTSSQMELPLKERARNVKDAFEVIHSLPSHVAIIDDVVTSGHTIHSLANTLRKAGVSRIDVWCVARACLEK